MHKSRDGVQCKIDVGSSGLKTLYAVWKPAMLLVLLLNSCIYPHKAWIGVIQTH